MNIFALSDPHLSLGTPGKQMDVFGDHWIDHASTIERRWRQVVAERDLVLIPGDISWATQLDKARPDLEFIGGLPGKKVLIRGNHDYWWQSISRIREVLLGGVYALQNDAVRIGSAIVCGTRLWDIPGVSFDSVMDLSVARRVAKERVQQGAASDPVRIYQRELERLRLSLQALEAMASAEHEDVRIVLTHFPPCNVDMDATEVTTLLQDHRIRHVVFGHLHNIIRGISPTPFGERSGVRYHLAACDYINFTPVLIDTV